MTSTSIPHCGPAQAAAAARSHQAWPGLQHHSMCKHCLACNRCGDPRGCCGYYAGCLDQIASPLQPYQSCWRKFQLNLTSSNQYSTPGVYYSPADVGSKWQPNNPGGAFTSGGSET